MACADGRRRRRHQERPDHRRGASVGVRHPHRPLLRTRPHREEAGPARQPPLHPPHRRPPPALPARPTDVVHDHPRPHRPGHRAAAMCRLLRLPDPSGLAVVGAGTVAKVHHHPPPPARPTSRPVRNRGRAAGAGAVRQGRRIPAARRDPLPRPDPPRRPTHRARPLPGAIAQTSTPRPWPISSGRPPATSPTSRRPSTATISRDACGSAPSSTPARSPAPPTATPTGRSCTPKRSPPTSPNTPPKPPPTSPPTTTAETTISAGSRPPCGSWPAEPPSPPWPAVSEPYRGWGRWVDMLGFRGHLATKSRRYSTTLGRLRQARRDYARHTRSPTMKLRLAGPTKITTTGRDHTRRSAAGDSPAWAGSPPATPRSPPPPQHGPATTNPVPTTSLGLPDHQPSLGLRPGGQG